MESCRLASMRVVGYLLLLRCDNLHPIRHFIIRYSHTATSNNDSECHTTFFSIHEVSIKITLTRARKECDNQQAISG